MMIIRMTVARKHSNVSIFPMTIDYATDKEDDADCYFALSLPGLSRDRSESPPPPRLVSNSAKEEVRKRSKYRLRYDLLLIPTKG